MSDSTSIDWDNDEHEQTTKRGEDWGDGRLPSGRPGIAVIQSMLELLLHVRLTSLELFAALVAAVHELSERNAELLAELRGEDKVVYGRRAQECNRLLHRHLDYEDLLFVLGEFTASAGKETR